jgi:hypothetical protein
LSFSSAEFVSTFYDTQFDYTSHAVFNKNKSRLIVNPEFVMIQNKVIIYTDLRFSRLLCHNVVFRVIFLCSLVGGQGRNGALKMDNAYSSEKLAHVYLTA